MAKEIIEAITKAETEAAAKIEAAKSDGAKLISEAKSRAEADYKEICICSKYKWR